MPKKTESICIGAGLNCHCMPAVFALVPRDVSTRDETMKGAGYPRGCIAEILFEIHWRGNHNIL